MGLCRPGDMGFDVVHINTHKTLATPHGGGGPGAGPVGVKAFLAPFLPIPFITRMNGTAVLDYDRPHSIGRMKSHFGHIGVLIRAYAYIRTMGAAGLRQASENAILNANYLQAELKEILPPIFDAFCMHECLLSGKLISGDAGSFAKRLIDHDLHPPTLVGAGCVYFPESLGAALLIEPTETETKEDLDKLIQTFKLVFEEYELDPDHVALAPHSTPVRKLKPIPTCNLQPQGTPQ